MVAECVGRDVDGQRIVQFLVVSNFCIYRHWESGELIQSQYPDAMASCKYVRKAFVNDTLPVPGPIFRRPDTEPRFLMDSIRSPGKLLKLYQESIRTSHKVAAIVHHQ
jgi:hypothetical protein